MNLSTNIKVQTIHAAKLKRTLGDKLQIYLMVGIPFLFFVIFVISPLLWVLRYAFYDYDTVRAVFTGLENFKVLVQDKIWWKAVYNTLYITFCGAIVGMPISLLLAVILNGSIKGRTVSKVILYIPCLISTAIVGVIFRIMLSPTQGIFNQLLMAMGMIGKPLYILENETLARWTIILVGIWQGAGYNMTLFLAGLQKIPKELYEAATIDGANETKKLLYITIPQLGNMLKMILMLSIVNGLKSFDLVSVLTNGQPNHGTTTIVTYIYNYFFEVEGYMAQQGYAAAASVLATLIICVVTLIYMWLSKNLQED